MKYKTRSVFFIESPRELNKTTHILKHPVKYPKLNICPKEFPRSPMVSASTDGAPVKSLVLELRCCKPGGVAKNEIKIYLIVFFSPDNFRFFNKSCKQCLKGGK